MEIALLGWYPNGAAKCEIENVNQLKISGLQTCSDQLQNWNPGLQIFLTRCRIKMKWRLLVCRLVLTRCRISILVCRYVLTRSRIEIKWGSLVCRLVLTRCRIEILVCRCVLTRYRIEIVVCRLNNLSFHGWHLKRAERCAIWMKNENGWFADFVLTSCAYVITGIDCRLRLWTTLLFGCKVGGEVGLIKKKRGGGEMLGQSRGQGRSFEAEQQSRGGVHHWQAREGRSKRVWRIETATFDSYNCDYNFNNYYNFNHNFYYNYNYYDDYNYNNRVA